MNGNEQVSLGELSRAVQRLEKAIDEIKEGQKWVVRSLFGFVLTLIAGGALAAITLIVR